MVMANVDEEQEQEQKQEQEQDHNHDGRARSNTRNISRSKADEVMKVTADASLRPSVTCKFLMGTNAKRSSPMLQMQYLMLHHHVTRHVTRRDDQTPSHSAIARNLATALG